MFELQEASRAVAVDRREYATQFAAMRNEFASQLAATRAEFASQLASAKSEARHLSERVDEATRKLAAADIVAYMAGRYAQTRRRGTRTRFRDYWRTSSKARRELKVIRDSIFFDEEYYLCRNPDVPATGMEAALHYPLHGGREGSDPGPFFSTRQYLVRYPDVAASGPNALAHYETHGRREKRNIPLLKG
jgi:O-antigen biosynthesis protein